MGIYKTDIPPRLFLISAYDRKPYGFNKPLASPPTPVSPCNSTHNPGTHPLQRRVTPPVHTQTQGLPAVTNHTHQRIQSRIQSPPFAVPRPPVSHPDVAYNADHRYDTWYNTRRVFLSSLSETPSLGHSMVKPYLKLNAWYTCVKICISQSVVLNPGSGVRLFCTFECFSHPNVFTLNTIISWLVGSHYW